ncbi:MobF family relaxase [Streptomyces sp. NPDC059708]|uniref:MobF family relaxase n=1 Tax=Streptomyces sp. NPDC059708 TaxID=3346916 RepID=UPI0036A7ED44
MMTLHAISAGSGIDYLMRTVVSGDTEISARDLTGYWASGGDTPGVWLGRQAAELNLTGTVSQQAADAIFKDGVNPHTGKPLGLKWKAYPTAEERYQALLAKEPEATAARRDLLQQKADRAGQQTARAGWESVFSPVKSWSVLWGVSNDRIRAQLEEAEAAAFTKVWERIEGEAAWTRVGPRGGQVQVEAQGLIGAAFIHRSSRAGDPDFHRHLAISSKVRDEEGRWLALDARPLHRITVALSEMYTTELEREMHQRFGIMAAPREDSIRSDKRPVREYLGVSAPVVSLFSQRRRQTEKALKGLLTEFREREGREPSRPEQYELAQIAALTARPDKKAQSVGAERREWRRRAWRAGISVPGQWVRVAQLTSRMASAKRPDPEPLTEVTEAILTVLEGSRETWTRANVEAEAYRRLTASGWHLTAGDTFDDVVRQVTEQILSPEVSELVTPPETLSVPSRYQRLDGSPVFVQVGSARYTSQNIKRWETELTEAATRPAPVTTLTSAQIDAALTAGDTARGFTPTDEQRSVVHGVFGGDVRVQAIIGPAGTGKTTIMRLIKEVADAHGIAVLGLAGGQVQADTLAEAAGIRAENIARWLTMSQQYGAGQPQWTLAPGTIVIVDEAGQASTPDLHALFTQAENVAGRMLPVGDPRQLGSPGIGGALALLETDTPALHLSEVRRFRSASGDLRQWEIDAALALSQGNPEASWEAYNARGRIHTGALDEMLNAAYEAWQQDTRDGLTSILIAPTNALAAQLSDRARADRVAAGLVDDVRTVTLADGNQAGAGERIVTRVNNRTIRCEDSRQYVRNGDVWTVEHVQTDGALLVTHSTTGGRTILPADYVNGGGVELGYAITKDRAQGVTVATGHGLLIPGMDANSAYPTLTRGTYTNHAYLSTDDQAVNLETGEPGRPLTGRQAWAAIVSRDGTQLSATATQRKLWDDSEAIRTHVHRLRYVLDDIADAECASALATILGEDLAYCLYTAPAWPALRSQLTRLADDLYDTDRLVSDAAASRDWTDVNDYAAILHSRIRNFVEGSGAAYLRPEDAERPATAPTYDTDPIATGDNILAAIGLSLPAKPDQHHPSIAEQDVPAAYAHDLAEAIKARGEQLSCAAQADARDNQGWAAAYGREPASLAEAIVWRDRIAAAAAYRDYADYTGADATGPAPTSDQPELRGLWRAAQRRPDAPTAYADALALATSGATWLDAVGTPPGPGDPSRVAWAHAVTAITNYRDLWEYGHETVAIGERPHDPVQAADHQAAEAAITAYRWMRREPALAEIDANALGVILARGAAGEAAALRAAVAIAAYETATRTQVSAEQAAEDAANRADAASRQAPAEASQPAERLHADAERAQAEADQARARSEQARAEAEAAAPRMVGAREAMRRAEDARRLTARELQAPQPAPEPPSATTAQPDWAKRPHGTLTDRELIAAAQHAVNTAVDIDHATDQQARAAAAGLREHAAALREESRTRALMDDERRTSEERERTIYRGTTPGARLADAYGDRTGPDALHAEHGRTRQPASAAKTVRPQPEAQTTPAQETTAPARRRPLEPSSSPASSTRATARLDAAYADRTGPDALQAERRRAGSPDAPSRSGDSQQPGTASKSTTEGSDSAPPAKKRRDASARLDQAYDRDPRGLQGDPRSERKRRRPPPERPKGPRI